MAFQLQGFYNIPIKKRRSESKSDLELLLSSGETSPMKPRRNFSCIFSELKVESPRKKLVVHEDVVKVDQDRKKPKPVQEFLFSTATFTSSNPFTIPEQKVMYEFNGTDHKMEAYESFKGLRGHESFVMCGGLVVLFEKDSVKAKGITGTIKKKLESGSDRLPFVAPDFAFMLLDEMVKNERIQIYSDSQFFYSTVVPPQIETEEFMTSSGKRYKAVLKGHILPSSVIFIKNSFCNDNSFSVATKLFQ